jgi:hypothetical protein
VRRPFVVRISRRRCSSRNGHLQVAAAVLLQIADDAEQVSRLGIASWPEHPDQALRLRSRRLAEFLKSNRRLDIIAQDRLSRVDITRQKGLDAIAQQGLGKSRISRDMLDSRRWPAGNGVEEATRPTTPNRPAPRAQATRPAWTIRERVGRIDGHGLELWPPRALPVATVSRGGCRSTVRALINQTFSIQHEV